MPPVSDNKKTTGAPAKKRGRKKVDLSPEALKKIKQIEENALREKRLLIAAEQSRLVISQLQDAVARLDFVIKSEGKIKLNSGKMVFLRGLNVKLDVVDDQGKRVKVDLASVSGR